MKRIIATLVVPALVAACASGSSEVARTAPIPSQPMPVSAQLLPHGTTLWVQLDQPLGVPTEGMSGSFTATVIQPIASTDGSVLVPQGARVEGSVVTSRGTLAPPPELVGVNPERIEVDGVIYPLQARVIKVDIALTDDDSPTIMPTAAGLGTRNSMIPGTIIEDAHAFLVENELGPDPGTVISLGSERGSTLPKGARLTLEVTAEMPMQGDPLTIR